MFVGIICACMPAAAHTSHHHLPSYDSIRSILRSRYGSLGQRLRRTYPTSSSLPEDSSHEVRTSRGIHEGYINLGTLESGPRVPAKTLQTFVRHGKADDLNNNGIHLTYEMRQSSA